MSIPSMDAAATTTTSTTTEPQTIEVKNPHLLRLQKTLDTYDAKVKKLQEDNAKLKKMLHDYKAANSRVRRIPRPTDVAM